MQTAGLVSEVSCVCCQKGDWKSPILVSFVLASPEGENRLPR